MIFCITVLGPLDRLWVTGCEGMQKNGFRFALAMGLDGVVWRFGSDWYGSESKLEAMWPSDGVGDR